MSATILHLMYEACTIFWCIMQSGQSRIEVASIYHACNISMICYRSVSHLPGCYHDGLDHTKMYVTAKIEVPRKCGASVVMWVVMAWERQLDCLWREGLRPRALANLEGDSTQ